MTDSLLAASVMAMCYYALRVEVSDQDPSDTKRWSIRLGLAAGLGFMAKSFALAPTVLAVMAFLLWKKQGKMLFQMKWKSTNIEI